MTSGTYPWSFVTQIFHNGQPRHGDDRNIFEVMTSTLPKGTLGSVASLLAATLYQGNPDRNHKLWNIVSSERYTPYAIKAMFSTYLHATKSSACLKCDLKFFLMICKCKKIRSGLSKDRQHNDQNEKHKWTNNDLQKNYT